MISILGGLFNSPLPVEPSVEPMALIEAMALLTLLLVKVIAQSIGGTRSRRLMAALDIAIVPLLLVFLATAISKMSALVR